MIRTTIHDFAAVVTPSSGARTTSIAANSGFKGGDRLLGGVRHSAALSYPTLEIATDTILVRRRPPSAVQGGGRRLPLPSLVPTCCGTLNIPVGAAV